MTAAFERAKRLGRLMRHAALALGLIVSAVALVTAYQTLSDPAFLGEVLKMRFGAFAPLSYGMFQRLLFIALVLVQIAPLLLALAALRRVFGAIAESGGLDVATARAVRASGLWFGAAALAMLLSTPLLSLVASIGRPEGQRFVSVGVETQHLLAVLLAAVLVTLGHVLALAAEIADDNRLIV